MANKGRTRSARTLVLALIAVGIVGVGIRFFLTRGSSEVGQRFAGGNPSVTAEDAFDKLVGRWRRPDGGYIMNVRSIDAEGEMQVDYYNPKPINVSKARVTRDKEWLKAFVELTDVGYPGATYDLTYDPHHDILKGSYFQPAVGQSFDVEFVRVP